MLATNSFLIRGIILQLIDSPKCFDPREPPPVDTVCILISMFSA